MPGLQIINTALVSAFSEHSGAILIKNQNCDASISVGDWVRKIPDGTVLEIVDNLYEDVLGMVVRKISSTVVNVLAFGRVGGLSGVVAGQRYWLDATGNLTTTAPLHDWQLGVGIGLDPATFFVKIDIPIRRV